MLIVGSSHVINKELGGLQIYNAKYGGIAGNTVEERKEKVQRTIKITCKTWDFSVNIIDGDDYTEDEIKILESENHCLSYFNPILLHISSNRRSVTRERYYGYEYGSQRQHDCWYEYYFAEKGAKNAR